ncbi:hypothetical protein B0T22DRAFT_7106 [Podospora appendiculata]|uniref:Uncharacterized protein n=1 Tax=Podospora appendiculata TaxID=314037 RepID=A0AAE0XF85_9PEZI|nr:hypothetical protein B0T22DRAFT_7106 [Podospora appendiculata]
MEEALRVCAAREPWNGRLSSSWSLGPASGLRAVHGPPIPSSMEGMQTQRGLPLLPGEPGYRLSEGTNGIDWMRITGGPMVHDSSTAKSQRTRYQPTKNRPRSLGQQGSCKHPAAWHDWHDITGHVACFHFQTFRDLQKAIPFFNCASIPTRQQGSFLFFSLARTMRLLLSYSFDSYMFSLLAVPGDALRNAFAQLHLHLHAL